jgi:molecular chaperone DnaJ
VSMRDYVEKDFYKTLGVPKDANADAIKKAYRKLARDLHPDKNPGDASAEQRFKDVSEAYDVLSNETKRREYDEARSLFGTGGLRMPSGAGSPGQPFDLGDMFGGAGDRLGDLFGGLFSGPGGGRVRRGGSRSRVGARGADVETDATLDFAEAVNGVTVPLRLSSPGACQMCFGTGARPGTAPHECPRCHGSGLITRNQGAFAFSEPCPDCRGSGRVVDEPCPECGGAGATMQTRTITVRIPAGVSDGQRIRIPAKGSPGEQGGPPGDLFVRVHVRQHDLFGRKGNDLTLTVPVTFAEAALGATVRVPTLDGAVTVKIPAGTPSGKALRVRGRGVAAKSGRGDLLITVEIAVPSSLSQDARDALEKYAAAQPEDPRPHITARLKG